MKPSLNSEQFHTLRRMWQHPRAERHDLIAFQNRKLRCVIRHAYANVPYYRELFVRAGLQPEDVASIADLQRIPPTSKDDLRARPFQETLAAGTSPRHLVTHMTSGSSGKPFTIRRAPREEHLVNMFRIRARHQIGMKLSDRIAGIKEPRLGGQAHNFPGRLRQVIGIHRNYDINCFQSSEAINQALDRIRPDVVHGYPSTLAYTAESRKSSVSFHVAPRLVMTGGEVLSPPVREVIEQAFEAPLFDFYGAHEFNLLAWECPHREAYHVCDDNVIVEILGQGTDKEENSGEVVVTALHAHAMPFIRYRTGDIATRGPASCPCGQPFSTLSGIQGRTVELLRLPGNRVLHPFEITGPLIEHHRNWIAQHQVIHASKSVVKLRLVPRRQPTEAEMAHLQNLGRRKLGPGIEFAVDLVERFAVPSGGKFSPYLGLHEDHSEVSHDVAR